MAQADRLLSFTRNSNASDLHLVAGRSPRVRLRGQLEGVPNEGALSNSTLENMMRELVSPEQWESFKERHELDFAYALEGVGRFRGNFFQQSTGAGAVFRLIPDKILTVENLNLPKSVQGFAHLSRGLVLATGPTGSGKSTTLAALIDLINATYEKHIITIEEPIEFVHKPNRSMFSQREVGIHCKSFAAALRAAVRQNPDVLLVGELRGPEIELAIGAAEMGTLVFGTLHTNSAAKTIDRLIDGVPRDAQEKVRTSLAENLAGICSQSLIPTADGQGRVAALEIMVRTSGLPNLIREGNTPQINSMIQSGRGQGMQALDDHLWQLVEKGRIRTKDAYTAAVDKTRFEDRMNREAAERTQQRSAGQP